MRMALLRPKNGFFSSNVSACACLVAACSYKPSTQGLPGGIFPPHQTSVVRFINGATDFAND
jgi:hypothetical protein